MNQSSICLWSEGRPGVAEPLALDSLSALHPFWAKDATLLQDAQEVFLGDAGRFLCADSGADAGRVVVCGKTATTMDTSRVLMDLGVLGEWDSVIAVEQGAGRGQLRRPWVSPPGNMHATLVLPKEPEKGPWAEVLPTMLPVVLGWLFCDALEQMGAEVQLKWPNDLVQEDRKIAGILVEDRGGVACVGIGMNLAFRPGDDQMRRDAALSAGILGLPQGIPGVIGVWLGLVGRLKLMYGQLLLHYDPSEFLSLAVSKLVWRDRVILVREGEEFTYRARIVGLSSDGGLVLSRNGEETVLHSGAILPA